MTTLVEKLASIKSGVAQSAERVAVNHWVGGSNPSAGANKINKLRSTKVNRFLAGYGLATIQGKIP